MEKSRTLEEICGKLDKANAYCFIGDGRIVIHDEIYIVKTEDCLLVPKDSNIIIESINELYCIFIETNLGNNIKTMTITNIINKL